LGRPLLFAAALAPSLALAQGAPPEKPVPLTLEEAISQALAKEPSLEGAAADSEAARARIDLARVLRRPTVTGSAAAGVSPGQVGGADTPFAPFYTAGVTARVPIYDFGRAGSQIGVAVSTYEATRAQESVTRAQVAFAAAQAYYALWAAQELLTLTEEVLAQSEARVEVAKSLFAAGARPKIDVARAEVDRSSAEVDRRRAEGEVKRARVALTTALGGAPPGTLFVAAAPPTPAPAGDEAALTAAALSARPEFAALEARRAAQEQLIEAARASRRPDLSGVASADLVGRDVASAPLPALSAQLVLTVPLYDGGRAAAEAAAATAELRSIEADLARLRLAVGAEVGDAYAAYAAAAAARTAAAEATRLASENEALARGRYEAGAGSAIEISDATLALARARSAEIAAVADEGLARLKLELALGGFSAR
jgi:outer membrane protein